MSEHPVVDVTIIGAGPAGLAAAYYAGHREASCRIIESLEQLGGQVAAVYPEKHIFDIAGFPKIGGQEYVDRMVEQGLQYGAEALLGEAVETLERVEGEGEELWSITTDAGGPYLTRTVIITAGHGAFEPRTLPIEGLEEWRGRGLHYFVKRKADFAGKRCVIVGGGDSALDWTLNLAPLASHLTLLHRRAEFRAAPDSVNKMMKLVGDGKIDLVLGQVTALEGADGQVSKAIVKTTEGSDFHIACDAILPFFGLTMKLGPVANWGVALENNLVPVDTAAFETNIHGIFAIGDINTYSGKLKLILSGFHEGALMAQKAHRYVYPDKRLVFQYTTSSSSLQKKLGVN